VASQFEFGRLDQAHSARVTAIAISAGR